MRLAEELDWKGLIAHSGTFSLFSGDLPTEKLRRKHNSEISRLFILVLYIKNCYTNLFSSVVSKYQIYCREENTPLNFVKSFMFVLFHHCLSLKEFSCLNLQLNSAIVAP
jgi:hypothetical protein